MCYIINILVIHEMHCVNVYKRSYPRDSKYLQGSASTWLWHCTIINASSLLLSRYARYLARVTNEPGFKAKAAWSDHLCQVIVVYDLRLDSRVGTEGSMVSPLNCDGWLILRSEALSH